MNRVLGLRGNFRRGEASLWAVSSASIADAGRENSAESDFTPPRRPRWADPSGLGLFRAERCGSWDPCDHFRKEGGPFTEAFGNSFDHPCNIKAEKNLDLTRRSVEVSFRNDGER